MIDIIGDYSTMIKSISKVHLSNAGCSSDLRLTVQSIFTMCGVVVLPIKDTNRTGDALRKRKARTVRKHCDEH